jgi:uroporphyrin-III C-methyltransferase
LAEKLIAHGLPPETPAAVVESLGSPSTQAMTGSLKEIATRLAAAKPVGPCLILYGIALAGIEQMDKLSGESRTS